MKLILTAEVDHLGSAGDTVEVKDGYGRNYLLPRGLAIAATRGAERQADEIRRARGDQDRARPRARQRTEDRHRGAGRRRRWRCKAAGDSGKLFGSVTAADVVAAIKKAGGPNLDKRTVSLPKAHIKSVGTHPVAVRLHPDVDASVSLNVVGRASSTSVKNGPGEDQKRSSPGRCCLRWRTFSSEPACSEPNLLLTCADPGRNTTRPRWQPATTRRRISHPQISRRSVVRLSAGTCATTALIHRFSPTPQHRLTRPIHTPSTGSSTGSLASPSATSSVSRRRGEFQDPERGACRGSDLQSQHAAIECTFDRDRGEVRRLRGCR